MTYSEIIIRIVFGVIFISAIRMMLRSFYKDSQRSVVGFGDGFKALRLGGLFEIIGWAGIAVGFLIAIFGMLTTKSGDYLAWLILPLFFALLGVPLILARRKIVIRYSDIEITRHGIFGRTKRIAWNEVTSLKFVRWSQRLVLSSIDINISIDIEMIGFTDFVGMLKVNLKQGIYEGALKDLDGYYQQQGLIS